MAHFVEFKQRWLSYGVLVRFICVRGSCRFKDALSIFKILTSPSILINWQLFIKHAISFPFQYLCMYVCMYVYVCVYVGMYVCIFVCLFVLAEGDVWRECLLALDF